VEGTTVAGITPVTAGPQTAISRQVAMNTGKGDSNERRSIILLRTTNSCGLDPGWKSMNKPRLPQLYSEDKEHYTILWVNRISLLDRSTDGR
jgi:hypothetical protein